MRARDVRAIAFCVGTTVLLVVAAYLYLWDYLKTLLIGGAWAAFVCTRPRMLRVFRRLRGEPDWSGYYKND
jgi:hypothetical protein